MHGGIACMRYLSALQGRQYSVLHAGQKCGINIAFLQWVQNKKGS